MKISKILPIISIIFIGSILIFSKFDFQLAFYQGDHGRDLYAFNATLNGGQPYKDYWWVYGPIMPYYYSLFLKFFGVSIQSILLGKSILTLLAGIFFFLALKQISSTGISVIGSIWFFLFNPDFTFTYNHIGGIPY